MKKTCTKCKEPKPILRFSRHSGFKDGRNSICKRCKCEYEKTRYRKNHIISIKRNKKFRRRFLLKKCCIDCGEKNPLVLEFDHIKGKKLDNVSHLIHSSCSLKKIKEEIRKCEIRCANCHRIITHKRRVNC